MNKILLVINLMLLFLLTACNLKNEKSEEKQLTRIYKSEHGDIEVPANPKRIVVLNSALTGDLLSLKASLVGVEKWSKSNPSFKNLLNGVQEVSDENLEQIIELNPDLIITASTDKNIDKLKTIAPTVSYTYNKIDYLTQFIEIGKLINKEKEAENWVEKFRIDAKNIGKKIKEKIGENATVSVIESYDKQIYIFGRNFARGTEILYGEMGLKMSSNIEKVTSKSGYYPISPEVLSNYVGDYIIFSKNPDISNSFEETKTYKNIDAVKKNRVFYVDSRESFYNDPITLENQLNFFKKSFLGE